jgi:hypothetical protein
MMVQLKELLIAILDVDFTFIEPVAQYFIYLMHLSAFLFYYLIKVFHYLKYFIDDYSQYLDVNFLCYFVFDMADNKTEIPFNSQNKENLTQNNKEN